MSKIYFDNNATTHCHKEVIDEMSEIYSNCYNYSAMHYYGRKASAIVNLAKSTIKELINAYNYKLIATSCGTEANNLAILGMPKDYKIIVSAIEHPCVYQPALLRKAVFVKVKNNGIVDLSDLEEKVSIVSKEKGNKFLVSIMHANNETGIIQPIKEAARITHKNGGVFHSDMIQSLAKINIDLEDLNVDIATISAHKINGPQGSAALLLRNGIELSPLLIGGGQEENFRSGTLNIAAIVGFAKALDIAVKNLKKYQKLYILRDYMEKNIQQYGNNDVVIFGQKSPRIPNTSYFATNNINSQIQLIEMDLNNICIATGSACSSKSFQISRILHAMGVDEKIANCAVRISFSLMNNVDEVDKFLMIWKNLHSRINKTH